MSLREPVVFGILNQFLINLRFRTLQVEYYNLDAIISVGYRVNSKEGVQFRKWTSQILKEHLILGVYSL
jgi:hypothetical protein